LGGQALKWPNGTRGKALLKAMAAGRARAKGEEMIATSHGRRSWKDSPKAKRIAVTIALLLIAGLIAMLAVAFLFTQ
jgi:hypothetical protein